MLAEAGLCRDGGPGHDRHDVRSPWDEGIRSPITELKVFWPSSVDPVRIERGAVTETYFVACRYFASEKWEFAERVASSTSPEHFDLLIILEGHGAIGWGETAFLAGAASCCGPAWVSFFSLSPRPASSR